MALEIINVGTAPNAQDGDPLRNAFVKAKDNFATLASASGAGEVGVADAGDNFPSTTKNVEAVIAQLATLISGLQTSISAMVGGLDPKGNWNASSGSFPGGGAAQKGWFYIVSTGGTVDGVEFAAGDRVIALADDASTSTYTGNWLKDDQTDAVSSVVGLAGAITKSALLAALNIADGAQVNPDGSSVISLIDAVLGTSWKTGVPDFSGLTERSAIGVLDFIAFANQANGGAVESVEWQNAAQDLVQLLATRTLVDHTELSVNHRVVLTQPLAGSEDDQLVEIERDDYTAYLETVLLPQRIEVTASRNLIATDGNNELYSESASNFVLTVPAGQAKEPIIFHRDGTGTLTVTGASGVDINGADGGSEAVQTQYKSMVLRPLKGTDEWSVEGDIA